MVGDELGNSSSDQPSISLKCYQPCNTYPMQLKNELDVSTKEAQLSLIDPTPPQQQPWQSCKLANCDCPLIGTPNLDSLGNIQSYTQRQQSCLLYTAAVEPTMETSEDCNDIINHASEVGCHQWMDRAVGVVPDFLDDSFDGAGYLLDLDPSLVLGRVDFLKVKQVHSRLINKQKSKMLSGCRLSCGSAFSGWYWAYISDL